MAARDQKSIWKEFGPWLRRQREISGKSRKWVADQIGIHLVQLARIETGESGTRKDTLDALIACLSLNAEETYIRAGLWPKTIEEIEEGKRKKETIEEALDAALFFDRKGLSKPDRTALRPLLEVADREVERLTSQHPHTKPSRTPTSIIRSSARQRDEIDEWLDNAHTSNGMPLSEKDRKTIREIIEKRLRKEQETDRKKTGE